SSPATAAALFRHAAAAQDPERCHLIQALLEPDQPRTREGLLAAGFEELAVLAYMRARAMVRPHELDVSGLTPADAEPIRTLRWSETNRPAFERAILASYEQTQDCPGLLGRRRIEDILAGHMAAGLFRPDLWSALYAGDEPVGVMLLNDVPASDALELVYLGLAVPWRGRGLARRLVRHGLGQATRCDRSRMILAVDESNAPALHLYRDLGFRSTGRKRAMIYTPA
ncbi:MAG: GNAT family N-acetyltransferase, partial [Phycisphaeraceae bacterium]